MNFVISEKGSREINEDSFCISESGNTKIYMAADGCGGHSSGEIASKLATEILLELFLDCDDSADSIREAVNLCNRQILEKQNEYPGMRTTIVGLLKLKDKFWAFNVGDSRLYQVRDGKIVFQTDDHSVPYILYKADIIERNEINTHEDRNKLLEALGNKDKVKVNVYELDVKCDDVFVIATDGFWEHFYDNDFSNCVRNHENAWLCEKKQAIGMADDPEQDNYTAVIVGGIYE
ncbi:MAG: protein phosphatase 2C domain-containing protein [Lachnospiraceae bacterium]|nr:protein phosphatase 2C domain-containing protein [Lachnospiraceae bacterium]